MPYIPVMNEKDTLDPTKVQDAVWWDVGDFNVGHLVSQPVGGVWATAVVELKFGITTDPDELSSFSTAIKPTIASGTVSINGVDGLTGIKYLALVVTTADASDREIKPTLWAESTVSRG